MLIIKVKVYVQPFTQKTKTNFHIKPQQDISDACYSKCSLILQIPFKNTKFINSIDIL